MPYKDRFSFNYYLPTRIVFGAGELKNISREMDSLKIKKALVVTDAGLKDSPMVKSLLSRARRPGSSLRGSHSRLFE